jgi:hypothetical protein
LFANIIYLDEFESYDLKDIDREFTDKKIMKIKFRFLELFGQKYNIVIYIRELNVRTNYFKKLIEKMILMNNRTR